MIFGIVFVLILLSLDIWIFRTVYRILTSGDIAPEWNKRVIVFLILGLGIGVYFAFLHKHESAGQLRFTGFPIPQEIFRLQDGEWKNVSPPQLVRILARIADFVTGFAVALFSIKI